MRRSARSAKVAEVVKAEPPTPKRARQPKQTKLDDIVEVKKRANSSDSEEFKPVKKAKSKIATKYEEPGIVATAEAAAAADAHPPLATLMELQEAALPQAQAGDCVAYWMRMEDLRVEDNTALFLASATAQDKGVPLVVVHILSPGDYKFHDRAPRRIDFVLRNLRYVKSKLAELNIPFYIVSQSRRLAIPRYLVEDVLPHIGAKTVFANIEYEVDELRRDIDVTRRAQAKGMDAIFVHDRLAVPPGRVLSKAGTPMSVFSPWQRTWAKTLADEPDLLHMSPVPRANGHSIKDHPKLNALFTETEIPESVEGFECDNPELMKQLWPEGTDAAKDVLLSFFRHKVRKSQLELHDKSIAEDSETASRVRSYNQGRSRVDGDTTAKISPYLSAGVLSTRMVLNMAKDLNPRKSLESTRDTSIGQWVMEVAWRDFYNHVMAAWPRVSMGRPFREKYADLRWEEDPVGLQAWKAGMTGYPIVDAAMRALKTRGWLENRLRMVVASFLSKHLMIDWHHGEKWFMQNLIDGDLASNNGGWQWTASTGTDPQPYFRIFNPQSQAEKCDPNSDYIRYWVPELKGLDTKLARDPFHLLPISKFKELGYPKPIVEHKFGRERALERFKEVV